MNSPYDILGVPRSASDEAIKAAFHGAARACHPDLNAGDAAAEQKLRRIIAAYDALKSPERRAACDQILRDRRRALARRLTTSAVATLAGGAVVVLGVSLLGSQPYQHVASAPATPSLVSGDSKSSAPSIRSNAGEPTKVVVREEPQVREPVGATTRVAVSAEPAAPEAVTTKVAIREEPAAQELEGDAKSGHDEPVARKLMPATAVKRLAKGHDPVRPATAEIRSPALFGVAF